MAASALFFSVMALCVKLASRGEVPTMQIVFARSLVMTGITYGMLRHAGTSPLGSNRWLLLSRGVIGVAALSLFYFAIGRLPLGDATAIFYIAPVWTALSAVFILRERTARLVVAGMVVSLVGVALTAKPTFLFGDGLAALDSLAVLAALAASVLSGVVYTIVRKLRETDPPLVIIFYLSWVGVVAPVPFALAPLASPAVSESSLAATWLWPSGWTWVWLLGAGLATQLGQIALTKGLHLEKAGRATTVGYLQVAFAFVWGVLVFGTIPDALSLGGAILICASVLLVAKR